MGHWHYSNNIIPCNIIPNLLRHVIDNLAFQTTLKLQSADDNGEGMKEGSESSTDGNVDADGDQDSDSDLGISCFRLY